jgi:hypothetical protein
VYIASETGTRTRGEDHDDGAPLNRPSVRARFGRWRSGHGCSLPDIGAPSE